MLAVVHRRRFVRHTQSTLWSDTNIGLESFKQRISHFDECTKIVLDVYLGYMKQWVVMMGYCKAQKNMLEEEWDDMKVIIPHIPDAMQTVTKTFWYLVHYIFYVITLFYYINE